MTLGVAEGGVVAAVGLLLLGLLLGIALVAAFYFYRLLGRIREMEGALTELRKAAEHFEAATRPPEGPPKAS